MSPAMKIRFIGGVQQVTGSCTLLEYTSTNNTCRILVDCGVVQTNQNVESVDWTFDPETIDRVLITHAHMDHCGMLPILYQKGYRGNVYCTSATQELAKIILADLAKNSELFTESDIGYIKWVSVDDVGQNRKIGDRITLCNGVFCYFLRSSHMLGAAAVGISWFESEQESVPSADSSHDNTEESDPNTLRTILFSGDVGRTFEGDASSLHKPNMYPYCSDNDAFMVLESTYGGRLHGADTGYHQKIAELNRVVQSSLNLPNGKMGKLIIPAFAMERTQTIVADLYKTLKEVPVFESFKDINLDACNESGSYPDLIQKHCNKPEMLYDDKAREENKNVIKAEFNRTIHIFSVSPMAKSCNEVYKNLLNEQKMSKGEIKYVLLDKKTPTVSGSSKEEINSFLRVYGADSVTFSSDAICTYENIFTFRNPAGLYRNIKSPKTHKIEKRILWKELEKDSGYPCIVLAASGMCDMGSILECLKLWLPDPDATLLLTGFTSQGSNGEILKKLMQGGYTDDEQFNIQILIGDFSIRLADIKCRILDMSPYYSGHADRDQLLKFVFDNPKQKRKKPIQVFLNHGLNEGMEELAASIDERNRLLAEAGGLAEVPKTIIPQKEDSSRWFNLTTQSWEDGQHEEKALPVEIPDTYPIRYDYRTRTLHFNSSVPVEYVRELHKVFSDK